MGQLTKRIANMSPLKLALATQQLGSKRELLNAEPIAIIGIGCRFPGGADNPEHFWRLLSEGVDAITEIPTERWLIDDYYDPDPEAPGKMSTRYGGFLKQVDGFDAEFFGISPREMINLDPQQRLLMEVSWEALENANQMPQRVFGSRTGVFVGISSHDYSFQQLKDLSNIDAYFGTGYGSSVAAGRLSYTLGLTGPSLAVDTACSSSLVAVHLACQSLRHRECEQALAGGVNLILSPEVYIAFSKAKMLAADGHCKTFDMAADGFVRSEGCGVVILKRLTDAVNDGDNIIALIRGSSINQDGRSSGLTVPNGPSQQAVIRQALDNSGIEPAQIGYLETHGTGTSLGDPIEVIALGEVFKGRTQPLVIGSVKTNIGHLESAAGIAGLIKTVLALQHEKIPANLHFKEPNSRIPWNELPVAVPTKLQLWARGEQRRLAGVSSFGFSGTNAHVVLEEAPALEVQSEEKLKRPCHVLTLSANTAEALKALVKCYEQYLSTHSSSLNLEDICFTANTCRSDFSYRLSIVGNSNTQILEKIANYHAGQEVTGLYQGEAQDSPKIAFLFTGQGSQYVDMGRELYETQAFFRQTIDRCDKILRSYLDRPLLEVLYSGQKTLLDETSYTQPALFALEYALAELWQSWGIEPDVVMGHSVGEYVAACIAGVFSLEDGLKLIAARGRLMQTLCDKGDMLVLSVDETRATEIIQPYAQDVSIAAINSPENVVISGKHDAIAAIMTALSTEKNIRTKLLPVSHAFHSPMMEPMLAEFERVAAEVTYATPQIPLCSNVTGQLATEEIATPAYWCRHVRQPVRFAASMETLYQQDYEIFLEIGPKPSLLGMGRLCLQEGVGTWLVSLRQGQSDWQHLLQSLGELYVRGVPVDWSGFDQDYPRRKVALPTYPFQRQRYWVAANKTAPQSIRSQFEHPLLGQQLYLAGTKEIRFEAQISQQSPAYLAHHRIFNTAVLPAAAYLEMALAAGNAVLKSDNIILEEVIIQQALILPEDEVKTVQLLLTPEDSSAYSFKIFSLKIENEKPDWTGHVSGKLMEGQPEASSVDLAALQARCTEEIAVTDYYQKSREERGIYFGPSFQAIQKLWRHEGEAIGHIQLPKSLVLEATYFYLHPVLLDAAFQVLGAIFPDDGKTYIPVNIERLRVYRQPEFRLWSAVKRHPVKDSPFLMADLRIFAEDGQLIATLEALKLQKVNRRSLLALTQESLQDWLYEIEWQPQVRLGLPPDYMPTPTEISTLLAPYVESSIAQIEFYGKLLPQLDALSVEYILSAFQQMGWKLKQRFSTTTIAEQLGVVSQHQRLLGRLLEILAEEGLLRQYGYCDEWEVSGVPDIKEPSASLINTLLAQYPTSNAQLTLLARCGAKLAEVLRGKCDPLQLLFPDGDLTTTTQLYQESPFAQVMNTYLQKVVLQALERLPQGRGVRVLEIGAGTGGTTAYLLPHLPAHQTEYVFTDISPLFTTQAQEKFNDYPFVRYQVLDIEKAPEYQGFDKHQYDLVVAANVLHATKDLAETLQHIHSLLAPGGMLLLWEVTERQRWLDLTFGLTEGWWRFADRPDYPLLSGEQWQALLQKNRFTQVASLSPVLESKAFDFHQAVIVAQTAKSPLESSQRAGGGRWLIFADAQGIAQQLATLIRASGEACILVFQGQAYEKIDEQSFRIDPTRPEHILEAVNTNQRGLRGVVHCWSLDAVGADTLTVADLDMANQQGCGSTLHLVQALVRAKISQQLWLVTQGAVSVTIGEQNSKIQNLQGVAQSPLWGLGKVIDLEHPEINCVLVDLDPETTNDLKAQALFEEIGSKTPENQIAFRDNARYVARLVRRPLPEQPQSVTLRRDGTYLITGGLGVLGLRVAQWMIEQGARHLVLMGRRGASNQVQDILTQMEQAGAQVRVARADVSMPADTAKVLTEIKASMPPLRGIVHAAAVFGFQTIEELEWSTFESVLRPKVLGTWVLHQLTQEMSLEFFVNFSSMTSVWGSKRQSHYVAANHFLDSWSHYRRGLGLPALSINWGPWAGGMMTTEFQSELARMGIKLLPPERAIGALEYLLGSDRVQTTVAQVDWNIFKSLYEVTGTRLLLEQLTEVPTEKEASSVPKSTTILQHLENASAKERWEWLISYIQGEVAKILGFPLSQLPDTQQGFAQMGIDSLMTVDLRNRLQTNLGRSLPSTLAFDYPNIELLAGYVFNEVFGSEKPIKKHAQQKSDDELTKNITQLSERDLEALIDGKLGALRE